MGSRTVRGLEAISLSIPPTPGHSIVKRKHNEHFYNIITEFNRRSYASNFIYGGYGYFDNMNRFFGNNGFTIGGRHDFADKTACADTRRGVTMAISDNCWYWNSDTSAMRTGST